MTTVGLDAPSKLEETLAPKDVSGHICSRPLPPHALCNILENETSYCICLGMHYIYCIVTNLGFPIIKSLLCTVELPGVEKKDICIEQEGDLLRIEANRRDDTHELGDTDWMMRLQEHCFGKMKRTFQLPGYVDKESVKTSLDLGVLHVRFQKLSNEGPKKLTIA